MSLPLAHSLLRQLERPSAVRLNANAFWGWGFDVRSPAPEYTLDEIARFIAPAYETIAPDQHNERVSYYDHVKKHDNIRVTANSVLTMEIVRVSVPGESVCVIETIATWLRVRLLGPVIANYELYDGVVGPFATALGTPFPWPLGNGLGSFLTVEWLLVRERVPDIAPQPAFAPLTPGQAIIPRDTALTVPWRDQRYNWNGNHAVNHYFVTGDRSYVRLFATFITTGDAEFSVEIAGRLGGFVQLTGYKRAALQAATERR